MKAGGLTFVIWSTVEPGVAIICSCLPVLRPLYSKGIARFGFHGPWAKYLSKRSQSYGTPRASRKEHQRSSLTGTTLRSQDAIKHPDDKSWLKISDTELGIRAVENPSGAQSPISPLDKPLPPAYEPPEGDTAYHTWTWNLLNRERDEVKAPTLSRATMIKENGHPWKIEPVQTKPEKKKERQSKRISFKRFTSRLGPAPRLETHTPILDRSPNPTVPVSPDCRNPPLGFRRHSLERRRSDVHASTAQPGSANSGRAKGSSPSPYFSSPTVRSRPLFHPGPLNDPAQPSKPKPVARENIDIAQRVDPPRLTVRSSSTTSPPIHQLPSLDGVAPTITTTTQTRPRNNSHSHVSDQVMLLPLSRSNSKASPATGKPDQHSGPVITMAADQGTVSPLRDDHSKPPIRAPAHWSPSIYPTSSSTARTVQESVTGHGQEVEPQYSGFEETPPQQGW